MRYRMLDVRIWCDQKFRALSPLKPSGQALFIYLLSNPNTTSIPGLYRAGAAAMAEELAWPLEGFHEALTEIKAQGLVKVDLDARVVFIPNAMKYNKPQSPNVVKSWAVHWDEIPECDLKNEAYHCLQAFVEGLGKAFAQAFAESLHKTHAKNLSKVCRKPSLNQEQKQEQEQEPDPDQKGKQEEKSTDSRSTQTGYTENIFAIPLNKADFYNISKTACERWQVLYPSINVMHVLRQLLAWNEVNITKRKSRSAILRHIHCWLSKEEAQQTQLPAVQTKLYATTFEHNLIIAKKWMQRRDVQKNTPCNGKLA